MEELPKLRLQSHRTRGLHKASAGVRSRLMSYLSGGLQKRALRSFEVFGLAHALFDEIFHLSSPASPPRYALEPERTISANVTARCACSNCSGREVGFALLLLPRSIAIHSVSPQPQTYRGSVDCTGPRSSCDEGERCTEALLFESNRVRGTDVRIARLFNVYGSRTLAHDGRAVSNFITSALAGKPITVYGDGRQTLCR